MTTSDNPLVSRRFAPRRAAGAATRAAAALAVALVLAAAPAAGSDADAIVGVWQTDPTDKGYAHIEVTRRDGLYEGRIVWLSEPNFPPGDPDAGKPKADRLNPDPELRGQPIVGMLLMSGFRHEDGAWKGGRIYDPESGKTYKAAIRLDDEGNLRLRGFLGISLLGRTTVWVPAPAR